MGSMVNYFKIHNGTVGITFYIAKNFVDNIQVNSINLSQPNNTAESAFTANMGGFKRTVSFNFFLRNDGTDKGYTVSDGLPVDDTTTAIEQWDYLMDNVCQNSGSDIYKTKYTVQVYRGADETTPKTYTGTLDFMRVAPLDGEAEVRGSLTLSIGQNFFTD